MAQVQAAVGLGAAVAVEMIHFPVISFAVWWKQIVFSYVIRYLFIAVAKTYGAQTVDASRPNGDESSLDLDGVERGKWVLVKLYGAIICFIKARIADERVCGKGEMALWLREGMNSRLRGNSEGRIYPSHSHPAIGPCFRSGDEFAEGRGSGG